MLYVRFCRGLLEVVGRTHLQQGAKEGMSRGGACWRRMLYKKKRDGYQPLDIHLR